MTRHDTCRDGGLVEPHPSRLATGHPRRVEIMRRHADAVAAGVPVYADPTSGLSVFTATFLAARAGVATAAAATVRSRSAEAAPSPVCFEPVNAASLATDVD